MNVFILDKNMEKSAQMLDDAHLRAQINEATQILMANYNREYYPDAKIGHFLGVLYEIERVGDAGGDGMKIGDITATLAKKGGEDQ